jgi:predicted HAD superfamily hydrolase
MRVVTADVPEAGRHAQLDYVHRMIADRSCSVLSLDIFDTVLWRRLPRPTDLFGIVGSRLRASGRCPTWVTDATFRRMRIDAERTARKSRDALGTEVSLFDIWRAMPANVFAGARLEELVDVEVETERDFTVVDLDIAEVVQMAGKHDIPVVLVSDTYFTQDHLSYLLDRPELGGLRHARTFRSHQHGKDKGSGLFEIVLQELGHSPEQLVHIGDNEQADVEVPSELGIRTVHYRRLDESFEIVLEREREPIEPFGACANLDERHGDFGLTSLRAKTLQSRQPLSSAPANTAWRFGASVLGPVLTGFAEWVADWAVANGVRTLWCPMREGELLSQLVNNAARARGLDLVAKPIWLSRHVTSLASVDNFDTDSIHEFIRRSYQLSVRQMLAILELRAGEVPALVGELDTVIDNGDIAEKVSVALTESPHLRNRINVMVTAARERLIRSLRTAGALDQPEMALVDLGWGATIQFQLAKALRVAGIDVTPSGLYLATDDRSARVYLAGLRAEGYLAQAGHPREIAAPIVRSPEVLEQCVNAVCGSLIGFTEDGEPVLGKSTESNSQVVERKAAQDGILAFQGYWNRYVVNSDGTWPDLARPVSARDRLANILVSALRAPTADEATVFGNWVHEDNFGSSVITRVLPDDLRAAVPYLSPNDLNELHMRDSFWPMLVAASDPQLGAATRAIATGAVDPLVFEPAGDPFETRLLFRTADGRWHDTKPRSVRINHNGLSFARLTWEHHDTTEISLAIPGRPAIVRIDWIEARVIAGGHRLEHVLRWDKPEEFAAMGYADCRWLGANMVEFDKPESAISIVIADQAGGLVSSGQVTVAFAMLPQSLSTLSPRLPGASSLVRISGRLRQEYHERGALGVAAGAARVALRKLGGTV